MKFAEERDGATRLSVEATGFRGEQPVSGPVVFFNQNFVMSWGWTNALKTSALGRRISIVALATSSAIEAPSEEPLAV